jgi:acyl carrier protein
MAEPSLDAPRLRELAIEHCDHDPGPLDPADRLDAVGLTGFDLLRLVAAIEDVYAVEFPADLVTTFETVEDLTYFTTTKAGSP